MVEQTQESSKMMRVFVLILLIVCLIQTSRQDDNEGGISADSAVDYMLGQKDKEIQYLKDYISSNGLRQPQPFKDLKVEVMKKPIDCVGIVSAIGDKITVSYVGYIDETSVSGVKGQIVDKSKQPFTFTIGKGEVIKGWDTGLLNMCVNEQRRVIIPPHLAYGSRGSKKVPSEATLMFEIELKHINRPKNYKLIYNEIDTNSDNKVDYDELDIYFREVLLHTRVPFLFFEKRDTNQDFWLSYAEFTSIPFRNDEL